MQLSINTKITGRLSADAEKSKKGRFKNERVYEALRPFFKFIADPTTQDNVRISTPLYNEEYTGMGNNTIAYH